MPLDTGLELVRLMLRNSDAWCRLKGEGAFAVRVGWDQYVYVGSSQPCHVALSRTRELGLVPRPATRPLGARSMQGSVMPIAVKRHAQTVVHGDGTWRGAAGWRMVCGPVSLGLTPLGAWIEARS